MKFARGDYVKWDNKTIDVILDANIINNEYKIKIVHVIDENETYDKKYMEFFMDCDVYEGSSQKLTPEDMLEFL